MIEGNFRRCIRQLHLWSALVFGFILFFSGLTGSLLAWQHELDEFLNPTLMRIQPPSTQSICDNECKARSVAWLSDHPDYGSPVRVNFPARADRSLIAWYPLPPNASGIARHRQIMLDPYELKIVGERIWNEPGWQRTQWIPTLVAVHRHFLLGDTGKTVLASSGVALVASSLLGLLLWLPKNTWKAWRNSLKVHWTAKTTALIFSLHNVSGAFIAIALVVLGLTGAYFNQSNWFSTFLPTKGISNSVKIISPETNVKWEVDRVQNWFEQINTKYPEGRITRLQLPLSQTEKADFRVLQPLEPRIHEGNTRISINLETNQISKIKDPFQTTGTEKLLTWFYPLHSGEAFGVFGQSVISICGVFLCYLIASGIYLWLKRR
jgi:uncharacterized iron-regulated membrane protein